MQQDKTKKESKSALGRASLLPGTLADSSSTSPSFFLCFMHDACVGSRLPWCQVMEGSMSRLEVGAFLSFLHQI